ncbi:S-adenosyl-L-methionine-dependent methyltransferase [Calocera cornea HHB12733]|uniref:S-adenosyl-L-methionine-dependent methyltransferase n=1 Tax=Calocera cornea HHB12733 TaxID=1353952 RepID=A0A165C9L9_9BASI|nr:S-adenosyl-L-methionine-dependent methyltransferase [Calocera cornea HHB12733]
MSDSQLHSHPEAQSEEKVGREEKEEKRGEGTYALVSDEPERARLDSQHERVKALFDGSLLPAGLQLQSGDRVLDAGTGTGNWALDVARSLPPSSGVSIDSMDITDRLFPASPPPNVHFSTGNILALPPSGTYTLVHQRFLTAAFSAADWRACLARLYDALKPGGWLRMEEMRAFIQPATLPHAGEFLAFGALLEGVTGINFRAVDNIEQWVREAGFADVQVDVRRWPLGPGEEGKENREGVMQGWGAVRRAMSAAGNDLGMSDARWAQFMSDAAGDLEAHESWLTVHAFTARKPVAGDA